MKLELSLYKYTSLSVAPASASIEKRMTTTALLKWLTCCSLRALHYYHWNCVLVELQLYRHLTNVFEAFTYCAASLMFTTEDVCQTEFWMYFYIFPLMKRLWIKEWCRFSVPVDLIRRQFVSVLYYSPHNRSRHSLRGPFLPLASCMTSSGHAPLLDLLPAVQFRQPAGRR